MAQHQHALVRYATLDRCLSKFRFNKEELIDRCSDAVNRVTGDDKRLSEKTFFNDIRALREGVIFGREARIECVQGLYRYSEHGFSLFRAGDEQRELHQAQQELERLQERARSAWARIQHSGIDMATLDTVRVLLLGDEAATWAHITERDEVQFRTQLLYRGPKRSVSATSSKKRLDESRSVDGLAKMMSEPMEQRASTPPEGIAPDELAKWYFLEQRYALGQVTSGWFARWKVRREFGRVLSELRKMGL